MKDRVANMFLDESNMLKNELSRVQIEGKAVDDYIDALRVDQSYENRMNTPGVLDVSLDVASLGVAPARAVIGLGKAASKTTLGSNRMRPAHLTLGKSNKEKFFEGADPKLLNADGSPKTYYMGKPDGNLKEFGKRKNPVSGKDRYGLDLSSYQKKGHTFVTDNPAFAEDFYSRSIKATKDMTKLKQGEGNIYPVNLNAKKVFDPDDADNVDEVFKELLKRNNAGNPVYMGVKPGSKFKGKPVISVLHKVRDKSNGWTISENKSFIELLEDIGFDSQFVKEAGNKSPSLFNPENIKGLYNSGKYGAGRDYMNATIPAATLGSVYGQKKEK